MILLTKNTFNVVYLSLEEKMINTSNYFLLALVNDMTKEQYTAVLRNRQAATERLSRVSIKLITIGNPIGTNGEFKLVNNGYYSYKVYEQTSSNNLDTTDVSVIKLLEEGKANIKGTEEVEYTEHTDTTNTTNYLYVPTAPTPSAWQPTDESSAVAWYQKDTGITHSSGAVSEWADSANSYDMVQADTNEQPTYAGSSITFDGVNDSLQTTSQISLAGAFSIGIKLYPSTYGNTFLGDNTDNNELFKFTNGSTIRFRADSVNVDLSLDSGTFGDDYIVITRDSSNDLYLWVNGVIQTGTGSSSSVSDIDAIGIRNSDQNSFNGNITEIQIFSSESTALTNNINSRLSTL